MLLAEYLPNHQKHITLFGAHYDTSCQRNLEPKRAKGILFSKTVKQNATECIAWTQDPTIRTALFSSSRNMNPMCLYLFAWLNVIG